MVRQLGTALQFSTPMKFHRNRPLQPRRAPSLQVATPAVAVFCGMICLLSNVCDACSDGCIQPHLDETGPRYLALQHGLVLETAWWNRQQSGIDQKLQKKHFA